MSLHPKPLERNFSPEEELLQAIMERALIDLLFPKLLNAGIKDKGLEKRRRDELRLEAYKWFFNQDDNPGYGTFYYCCLALRLDRSYIRGRVFKWFIRGEMITEDLNKAGVKHPNRLARLILNFPEKLDRSYTPE